MISKTDSQRTERVSRRVLTLRQPWAWLVFNNGKDIENRTFKTRYRGLLWIHAAGFRVSRKSCNKIENRFGCVISEFDRERFLYSHVIGCVDLVDVVRDSTSKWALEKLEGNERDCYHWVIENPRLLESPFQAKGNQGLWNIESKDLKHLKVPVTN